MPTSTSQVVTGNTIKTEPENRAFYPALDGLRAVAFLMVFLEHYNHFPWGWAGVDLFFVLSGFLITGILFDSRNDTYRVRNFYVRRTLRIFPLYYGVMLLGLFLWPLVHWRLSWTWAVWPAYLGNFARFVHPYTLSSPAQRMADFQPTGVVAGQPLTLYLGHFWSLCVEEQFYLVWPWLVFWIRDRRKLMWCCSVTLAVCLPLRLLGQHMLPLWMLDNEVLYRFTPLRLDALLLGGLFALVLRGPSADKLLRYARRLTPLCMAAAAYLLAAFLYQHIRHQMPTYPEWKFTWGLALVDVLSGVMILLALQPGTIVYRALNRPVLRWLGRISYGAYVWHDIPHSLYGRFAMWLSPNHYKIMVPFFGFFGTLLLATLSFRFFETPFLNLKERWTIRGKAEASPSTETV